MAWHAGIDASSSRARQHCPSHAPHGKTAGLQKKVERQQTIS